MTLSKEDRDEIAEMIIFRRERHNEQIERCRIETRNTKVFMYFMIVFAIFVAGFVFGRYIL